MAEIFDELFDSPYRFITYMVANDNEKTRKSLLRSNQLKVLYCRFVCCRESVFNSIDLDSEHYSKYYTKLIKEWLREYKEGKSWGEIAEGVDHLVEFSFPAPRGIMSLEDEAKEMEVESDG